MTSKADQEAIVNLIKLNFHPRNVGGMRPKFINGHIVLGTFPKVRPLYKSAIWVVLDQGRETPRYAVGTWFPTSPGNLFNAEYRENPQEVIKYLRGKGVPV